MLRLSGSEQAELHRMAFSVRNKSLSNRVYFRGLVEFSNICVNDCFYCGIRKSNGNVRRYEMSPEEILATADIVAGNGITSIVLQSGERRDRRFIDSLVKTLTIIKDRYPHMGITLSAGEQERSVFEEFFAAGAERYLLRVETSDEEHYGRLHPPDMSFRNRVRCLEYLRETGFQVGTGVMINSPYQTVENLARDIMFLKSFDIDMCGMGPFIPHGETPFARYEYDAEKSLNLGLNMISVLRLAMPDINIASTTALETLSSEGRELGLLAGANVVMPQFSPAVNRREYMLYDNKPAGETPPDELMDTLKRKINAIGMVPEMEDRGDSRHFITRKAMATADKNKI